MLAVGSFTSLIPFQVRFSYLKPIPFTSLRLFHFTHLSTPQHKWLSHSIPQNHAVIPFRSTVACPPTLKTLQTLQDLQPSSHKSNQLNSIAFPSALCHSVPSPPMLFSNANPMVYFHSLRRVSPIKRLSGREVCLLHHNGAFLGIPPTRK